MQETTEVNGIVLSSMPVGEADRRLLLLTKELGKISCFARGARRPTSMMVGSTRPFAFGKFYIYPGKNSYTLQKCEISAYFEEIVLDIERSAYGCYFLELASCFTHENAPAEEMLALLYYSLKALQNEKIPNPLVRRIFELKTLTVEGLMPDPGICARCRKQAEEAYFRPSLMQSVCTDCGGEGDGIFLSRSTLYMLRYVIGTDIRKLFTFTVSDEVLKAAGEVADALLSRALERPLSSREMLSVLVEGNA